MTAAWLVATWLAGVVAAAQPVALPAALTPAFAEKTPAGAPVVPMVLQTWFASQPAHLRGLFARRMHEGLIGKAEHVRRLLVLRPAPETLELLLNDGCVLCHTNPAEQDADTLFEPAPGPDGSRPHLDLREFLSDVHLRRGLSCSGCHGGQPTDTEMTDAIEERWPAASERKRSRGWIATFCARCHADPAFMRTFAPSMPTDQFDKFSKSGHGAALLVKGDAKAPQCISCHGVHGIRGARSPLSPVHAHNVPATCGRCHADADYMRGYTVRGRPIPTTQLTEYKNSVHGKARLERGDAGAPACNDCHGNHSTMPPEAAGVGQMCGSCHAGEATAFEASKHKGAFLRHGWPECAQCHGDHAIAATSDKLLATDPGTSCRACHDKHAAGNSESQTVTAEFRTSLTRLAAAPAALKRQAEELAGRGLDTEPVLAAVSEIEDALRASRVRTHALERTSFAEAYQPGASAARHAEDLLQAARADFRFRRNGLLLAAAIMAALGVAVWLRLRVAERGQKPRDGEGPPSDVA